jgi:uncharacterized metal-binding protein (TIGR02443 family)
MARKKQFIAGAVCPECSDTDSLVLYADDQSVACVSCDFTKTSEQRDSEAPSEEIKPKDNNASLINIINLSD